VILAVLVVKVLVRVEPRVDQKSESSNALDHKVKTQPPTIPFTEQDLVETLDTHRVVLLIPVVVEVVAVLLISTT
jgi:hypothetical protein